MASMPKPLRRLAVEAKASVIVTVDCGISAVSEAELARELGPRADRHRSPHDRLRTCRRPRRSCIRACPAVRIPVAISAGQAVAFKLAWQICKSFRRRQTGFAAPSRLFGGLARLGGAGDDRRRGAAFR